MLTEGTLREEASQWQHQSQREHSLYGCWATTPRERLTIPEIVGIPFDRKPVLEVASVSGHHAARVRCLVGGPAGSALLLEP